MLDLATDVIAFSREKLPLLIVGADWNGANLSIWGPNWSFNTMSAFRLIFDGHRACGCYDTDMVEDIKNIVGNRIVSIEKLTRIGQDFSFVLEDNSLIQVFAAISIEPWIFSIRGEMTFVGNGIIP